MTTSILSAANHRSRSPYASFASASPSLASFAFAFFSLQHRFPYDRSRAALTMHLSLALPMYPHCPPSVLKLVRNISFDFSLHRARFSRLYGVLASDFECTGRDQRDAERSSVAGRGDGVTIDVHILQPFMSSTYKRDMSPRNRTRQTERAEQQAKETDNRMWEGARRRCGFFGVYEEPSSRVAAALRLFVLVLLMLLRLLLLRREMVLLLLLLAGPAVVLRRVGRERVHVRRVRRCGMRGVSARVGQVDGRRDVRREGAG